MSVINDLRIITSEDQICYDSKDVEEKSLPETCNRELILSVASRILQEHIDAFRELAK